MTLPFRQKLIRKLFGEYKKSQTKLHDLSYLFWECTLRCNLNCIHCGSDCYKNSSITDMPCSDFLEVLTELKNHYDPSKIMVVLTGGEPLLRKDLSECGAKIRKAGYPWGIVTNGFALNKQNFSNLFDAGLTAITISLDGTEKNHNWLRGNPKSYEQTLKALEIIVELGKNIVYDVVTCVNKRNIKELEEIRQLLINKGVKAWRLFTIAPIGRAKENSELLLSGLEIKFLFDYIRKCRYSNKIKVSFSCEAFAGEYDNEIRDGLFFCRAGINIASILADGSVSACPNINRNFIQGNVYNENFIDIWNKKFSLFRNRQWMHNGICETCKDYNFCLGGAMHLRNDYNSEILYCLNHELKQLQDEKTQH